MVNNCLHYVKDVLRDEVGVNQYGNHWNTAMPNGRKVCVHSFIGYDKNDEVKIANILPYNICCWGVGNGKKGSYNYNPAYIQFEICEDGLTDKIYYKKAFFRRSRILRRALQKLRYRSKQYSRSLRSIPFRLWQQPFRSRALDEKFRSDNG